MAAPTNSGEWDMVSEDFYSDLSSLLSPAFWPPRLTPSPPPHFLHSSSSMVIYQGSNQSMDDPPQNQEREDIVDPALYLAGDSALLQQQQQRQNWSEASDWRPRGGIMTTNVLELQNNNQGFEESNMGLEESEERMMTCFNFSPSSSPTNFPLYRPMPSVFFVSSEQENISLAFSYQHILEDKSGLDSPIYDNSFLNAGAWAPPPMQFQRMQTNTKVYKRGAVGRSIDIARCSGYEELKQDLARRFGIEGQLVQLEDRHRVGWILVYVDHENDLLLLGNDPWEEFLHCVRCIKILSPQEVQAMSLDGDLPTMVDAVSEKPSEYFGLVSCNAAGNDEIEAVGTGSEGIGNCVMRDQARLNSRCLRKRKTKGKNLGGGRRNKKTNGVRIEILSNNILQTEGMSLKDAANHLEAEAVGKWSWGTWQSDMEEGQLNSRYLGKEKKKEMTRGGEGRNKKNAISLEEILRCKEMPQKDAANHLKVSKPKLKTASRDYGIQRLPPRQKQELIRQSYPNETSVIVDEEGISQLNYDTLPSNQPLAATVDTNSGVVIKSHPPQFLPKARQENPSEDFGNYEVEVVGMGVEGTREGEMEEDEDFGNYEVEAVGMGVEGTGEGEMEEGQLNSGCLGKSKSNVETPGGDRGNKKTNGVKIAISLEDILQAERMYLEETGKQMSLDDAAKKFKVSRSTLKRVCRKYGILSWPPSKGNEHISQSRPKESPAVVDQAGVQQLNCDISPSNQAWAAIVDTNSVVLKARWIDDIIVKIRLPKPWKMAELGQQVEKRLKLESGTYYIRYKDEENELITILCDEDLQEYISSSRLMDTSSIEVFLVPK